MTKKTLEQWETEIDAGIARGKADFKAGRFKILDENFVKDLQKEVINEMRAKKYTSHYSLIKRFGRN